MYRIVELNNVSVHGNPELTSINLNNSCTESVGALSGQFKIADNPKLTSIGGSLSVLKFASNIDLSGNAFPSALIDQYLVNIEKTSDEFGKPYGKGKSVNLSGGTNAAPTGAGITAAQTLIARGCTVTVSGTAITTTKKFAFTIPEFDTVADKGKTLKVKADGTGLEWVA